MTARAIAADDLAEIGGLTQKTYQVTTGATPTDFTLPDSTVPRIVIQVTTGGTGGDEELNLVLPTFNTSNSGNSDYVGIDLVIEVVGRTDPSDVVVITRAGLHTGQFYNPLGHWVRPPSYNKLMIAAEGESVLMKWIYDDWRCNFIGTDWYFNYETNFADLDLEPDTNGRLGLLGPRIQAPNLPTADPHESGTFWNDAGTLKVSAG